MVELFHFIVWIKENTYLKKTKNYMALGPSYKLPKIKQR